MSTWIRRSPRTELERLTNRWHLRGEPPTNAVARGVQASACGETFSDPSSAQATASDWVPPSIERCPPCDAVYKAELRQL